MDADQPGSSSTVATGSSSISESHYESDSSSDGDLHAEPPVISLLDRLKPETPSVLGRKRAIHCNPPTGKKRSSGSRKNQSLLPEE